MAAFRRRHLNFFKHIVLNEKVRIVIQISLKSVPNDPTNNKSALVQIVARVDQTTSLYLNQ